MTRWFGLVFCCAAAVFAQGGIEGTQEADSLARLLFGEEKTEERAMALFQHGQEDFEAGDEFLREANAMRTAGVDTTMKLRGGIVGFLGQQFGDTSKSSREADTRRRAMASFEKAAKNFEKALAKQPEMKEIQLWLVAAYDRLEDWEVALPLYREILNERQGDEGLWFSYGYAAFRAKQYDKALTGLDNAMRIKELVTGTADSIPNSYRLYSGEAYIRTYQDKYALEMFRAAQSRSDSTQAAEIQKTIDWILWDDGGIACVEYRDAAFVAEEKQDWNGAREAYLGGIASARTLKARDFLTWRLSLVTYNWGNKTEGITRLQEVYNRLGSECPKDYVESYGQMLYAYGQELVRGGDRRGSLDYLLTSTKVPWQGQGGGYVAIAQVAQNDLAQSIENAERALTYSLTDEQKKAAYEILVTSHRAKGNWDAMKKYQGLLDGMK